MVMVSIGLPASDATVQSTGASNTDSQLSGNYSGEKRRRRKEKNVALHLPLIDEKLDEKAFW